MKKLIAIIAILALATSAFATESDPSETVGFYKISATSGYNVLSLPFHFYDATHTATTSLDEIIGGQLTGGTPGTSDRIWDANLGTYAFYMGGTWQGTLASAGFDLSNAYYIQIKNTPADVYLAGAVEDLDHVVDYGTMNLGYNVVGLNLADSYALDDLDLISSGFTGGTPGTSDRIWDANTGAYAFYMSGAWSGSLAGTGTTIGHAYYIQVKNSAFVWTFDPSGSKVGNSNLNKKINPDNVKKLDLNRSITVTKERKLNNVNKLR